MNEMTALERTLAIISNGDAIRLVHDNLADFTKAELIVVAEDLSGRLLAAEYMIQETLDGRGS